MRLHLFNPETEYALASGASFYTPPARVERLRKENQLLPEAWASPGDAILVDDASQLQSEFMLVEWGSLASLFNEYSDIRIAPWGWNHALIRKLKDFGVPESALPDDATMDEIRQMAHRRTTVQLNKLWNEIAGVSFGVDIPEEILTEEECMDYYRNNPGCWMKAPWSSSGRGVINTSADMTEELVRQWCHGIIRRQGSVMGETGASRKGDYATEWEMRDGRADYLGLSSFSTSNRGKYIFNNIVSQPEMAEEFERECNMRLSSVISMQKTILEKVLGRYKGLLGVDMIVEEDGKLRPFVEVNLRRTMGMVGLEIKNKK